MELTRERLAELVEQSRGICAQGQVASYIPGLRGADPMALGICAADASGELVCAGDCEARFTMQSISKVFSLLLAILDYGADKVYSVVGMESTGDAFNSIVKLETSSAHKPYNPMINAGAIEVASLIRGGSVKERFAHLLEFYRAVAESDELTLDEGVYLSEKETGDRNRAMAYFLESLNLLENSVEDTLDLYFRQCSVLVSAKDLAKMGLFLAQGGVTSSGKRLVEESIIRLVRSQIAICGMYDGSGEFAARVGIPSKSGVGGGILCAVPGRMGIGVYGPALDAHGNSIGGIAVLECIAREFSLGVF